ncbi:MAG: DUF6994 family protein [Rhodoluna sp.]
MNDRKLIDVDFDHRLDSGGRDLDKYSPTLKKHHQLLWSKPLPSGELFDLNPMPNRYLVFRPDNLVFALSSDQMSNSFRSTERMKHIVSGVPEHELDEFQYLGATVGGTILFPGKQINRKRTINQARGMSKQVEDRFDLTLECIRLQYLGLPNPLQVTLSIYWTFFELFETFEQYVEFFLLQDLVQDGQIKFYLNPDGFDNPALPQDLKQYREYMKNAKAFLIARNSRMKKVIG